MYLRFLTREYLFRENFGEAALEDYPSGPLQSAPKRVADGAVSFGKPKEYITANRAFYNRHGHARDAFEHFAFVFKAVV